jgi:DNA-binding NarL/FixJ family response regulator
MADGPPIRILCVDDHPLFREGIATVIASQPDMAVVSMAATAKEAIEEYRNTVPDVTLMDLRLPDMSGIGALAAIRGEFPNARIIMLTTFEGDAEVQRALAAGARGYMLKSTPLEELVTVIREVHRGRKHLPAQVAQSLAEHIGTDVLSEREIQVLKRIAEGNRNKDIGAQLSISEETVKAHVRHILGKLDARDRTRPSQSASVAVSFSCSGQSFNTVTSMRLRPNKRASTDHAPGPSIARLRPIIPCNACS